MPYVNVTVNYTVTNSGFIEHDVHAASETVIERYNYPMGSDSGTTTVGVGYGNNTESDTLSYGFNVRSSNEVYHIESTVVDDYSPPALVGWDADDLSVEW